MISTKHRSGADAKLDLWGWTSIIVRYVYYNNGCDGGIDRDKEYDKVTSTFPTNCCNLDMYTPLYVQQRRWERERKRERVGKWDINWINVKSLNHIPSQTCFAELYT